MLSFSSVLTLLCVLFHTEALQVVGFAYWSQHGQSQSNVYQDALMLSACVNEYNLESVSAATHDELVEMGIENNSDKLLIGTCGGSSTSCLGSFQSHLVDGRARKCWGRGETTNTTPGENCYHSDRSTLCVIRLPTLAPTELPTFSPSDVPTSTPTPQPTSTPTGRPTYAPSTMPTINPTEEPTSTPSRAPTSSPSEVPSLTPSEKPTPIRKSPTREPTTLSSFKQTLLPTAYPNEKTESCPETVERLDIVIDYLMDYVFCLRHEKDTENCSGSYYKI